MKERNLNTVFANISKTTSLTSDSFILIMSPQRLISDCNLHDSRLNKANFLTNLIYQFTLSADNAYIFCVSTVMFSPTYISAFRQLILRSITVDVVKIDWSVAFSELTVLSDRGDSIGESKLKTHNRSIYFGKAIVTNCPPFAAMPDCNTPFPLIVTRS